MSSYHGPAVVIHGGMEIPVEADLHAEHPTEDVSTWRGTVRATADTDQDADFWTLPGSHWGVLRLPGGRESHFTTTGHTVAEGRLEIKGSGTEPF
ncbi:DUF4873 domain-containing protein [Kitasatospora sp. GP82]|uniref:DUF4873 domain-containing protein n=1 Tax=Kitasatospora sp. GP82 TaxID=3035089 RepID=UPI002475C63A|nr:DUF4873 domain-containing protein [Kitasatospora sp. GP82]MDH6126528.1 hypothetical protein [Kitasatospora sp. GP82]